MCLLLFAYRVVPEYPLIVAANRDEFHERPTAPAAWWPDRGIFAGRDMEAGGTWMGVNRLGRFAAVTNFREPASHRPGLRSRGTLVLEALDQATAPTAVLAQLQSRAPLYNGFNLIFGDGNGLFSYGSRGEPAALSSGVYGLSNHLLETPWPKVTRGKAALRDYLDAGMAPTLEPLLDLLADRSAAPDADLPDTGVGIELERLLSPPFVRGREYGTRCSSIVLVAAEAITFVERRYAPDASIDGESTTVLARMPS